MSDLDVTFERYLGRPRQPDIIPRTPPVYSQLAATHPYEHRGVKKSPLALNGDSSASAGATCERLTDTAFIHAEPDVRAIDNLNESSIHAIGKTRMFLDGLPQNLNGGCICRIDSQHSVRIAHRDGTNFNLLPTHLETIRIGPFRCIKRQTTRLETRHTHIYRHDASALHARVNEPSRAVHRDRTRVCLPATVEKCSDAAGTIATLFNLGSIRIEYAVEHRGIRASGIFQDQCLIEADADAPIGELPELFGRRRSPSGGRIEHNEIVAGTVHLREIDAHAAKNSRIIPVRHGP